MKSKTENVDEAKKNAAYAAVKHIKNGYVVGLGSGSTAAYAIEALGERIRKEKLSIFGVPSSYQAFQLAVQNRIQITTLEEHPVIDVNIDGADQIDPDLNLIKGMGAALAREKIVAAASKQNIIIADDKKLVTILGENNHPIPTEVLPFAISLVTRKMEQMGAKPVLREVKGKLGPVISDNGNAIMDITFGPIKNAAKLECDMKMTPGVVETGLFIGSTDIVYVGKSSGTEKITRKQK